MKKGAVTFIVMNTAMIYPKFGENPSYDCWLAYRRVENPEVLKEYTDTFSGISVHGESVVLETALKELRYGLSKMLGTVPGTAGDGESGIVLGLCSEIDILSEDDVSGIEDEGYIIRNKKGR